MFISASFPVPSSLLNMTVNPIVMDREWIVESPESVARNTTLLPLSDFASNISPGLRCFNRVFCIMLLGLAVAGFRF